MTPITCRLNAKNRDQLWNPTLVNRVWAAFSFTFTVHCYKASRQSDLSDYTAHWNSYCRRKLLID